MGFVILLIIGAYLLISAGVVAGAVTILDTDGNGSIVIDNAPALSGGAQYGDNRVFRGTDANGNSHLYTFVSGDKTTGGDLIVDGAMLVKGYSPTTGNHMGISFADAVERMRWRIRQAANDASYAAQLAWRIAA